MRRRTTSTWIQQRGYRLQPIRYRRHLCLIWILKCKVHVVSRTVKLTFSHIHLVKGYIPDAFDELRIVSILRFCVGDDENARNVMGYTIECSAKVGGTIGDSRFRYLERRQPVGSSVPKSDSIYASCMVDAKDSPCQSREEIGKRRRVKVDESKILRAKFLRGNP